MIEDLRTGLKLAGGVVDLAKNINELSKKGNDLELKEAASELRSQTIDLKETVNEMREHIVKLEERLLFKEKLSFNGKVFEYHDDIKKYICNGCEANGKYVHMTETTNDNGYHAVSCPVCKNNVELNLGKSVNISYASTRDGWEDF